MPQETMAQWIDQLASKSPTPGGGGAAALVGAVGTALGSMVGNLTVGKKKYADVEADVLLLMEEAQALTARFEQLVQEDAASFLPLSAAYSLPQGTEEEKVEKEQTIQQALIAATETPLKIARCAVASLRLLEGFAAKGSVMVLSDAGVGAACARAALQGARLNVLINLKLMKDQERKVTYKKELDKLTEEGLLLADKIYDCVEERL